MINSNMYFLHIREHDVISHNFDIKDHYRDIFLELVMSIFMQSLKTHDYIKEIPNPLGQ